MTKISDIRHNLQFCRSNFYIKFCFLTKLLNFKKALDSDLVVKTRFFNVALDFTLDAFGLSSLVV